MNTYGSLNLTDSSPAQSFSEPLTLAEVKKYLNLPDRSPADEQEDAQLEGFISGARVIAEGEQGRDLIEKQWDKVLDYFICREIKLRDPLRSVDLFRIRDSDGVNHDLAEDTDYIVDLKKHPGIVLPPDGSSWPTYTVWPSSAILIRFTSGYSVSDNFWSNAGKRVKVGMLELISHWHNGRLPFEPGSGVIEYPWTVTQNLRYGSLVNVG